MLGAAASGDVRAHHVTVMNCERECRGPRAAWPLASPSPQLHGPLPLPHVPSHPPAHMTHPQLLFFFRKFQSLLIIEVIQCKEKKIKQKQNPKKPIHQTYCLFHF